MHLNLAQLKQFVLPHLMAGAAARHRHCAACMRSFNDLLRLLYMGCQWKELLIETGQNSHSEIHYSRIYRMFRYWQTHDCFDRIFTGSVATRHAANLLENRAVTPTPDSKPATICPPRMLLNTCSKKQLTIRFFNGHK